MASAPFFPWPHAATSSERSSTSPATDADAPTVRSMTGEMPKHGIANGERVPGILATARRRALRRRRRAKRVGADTPDAVDALRGDAAGCAGVAAFAAFPAAALAFAVQHRLELVVVVRLRRVPSRRRDPGRGRRGGRRAGVPLAPFRLREHPRLRRRLFLRERHEEHRPALDPRKKRANA